MSEHRHPELHPDPDSLSAFIEGVLPEHERLQCLTHLAECSRCREVVFLAQEPQPALAISNRAPARRRWFAPVPALAAAAAVCIVVLAAWLYRHYSAEAPPRDVVARVQKSPVPVQPSVVPRTEAPRPPPIKPDAIPSVQSRTKPVPKQNAVTFANRSGPRITTPELPPPPAIQNQQPPPPPVFLSSIPLSAWTPHVDIKDDPGTTDSLSAITGTVTDQTGAAIATATVTLRQRAGTFSANVQTDGIGQFKLTGLPAGHYELQITKPGFRQTSKQIDLQPKVVAIVASELAVGSVAEAVAVTASTVALETSTSTVPVKPPSGSESPASPRPLPAKLPATITVRSGKVMVAVDSAGALFVSQNAGKSWKAVKPVWSGKVVRLVTPAEPSQTSAAFQLTTDSDSTWLSRDGRHWYPAPSPR